jgi:hypothetical protein
MPAHRTASKSSHASFAAITKATDSPPVSTLTFAEFSTYLTTANTRLYALLEKDEELHRLVYAIELIDQSNRSLEEIRNRQNQHIQQQFQLAIERGLEKCIQPLVRKERKRKPLSHQRTFPSSSSSSRSTGSPRPRRRDPSLIQRYVELDDAWYEENDKHVDEWNKAVMNWSNEQPKDAEEVWKNEEVYWGTPKPLEERLSSPHPVERGYERSDTNPSMPRLAGSHPSEYDAQAYLDQWANDGDDHVKNLVALANTSSPPVSLTHLVLCALCGTDQHHTPDCPTYKCHECDTSQAGHYPADCPNKDVSYVEDETDLLVAWANNSSPRLPHYRNLTCAICNSDGHRTHFCPQYICYECNTPRAGHTPSACPEKSPSIYYDALAHPSTTDLACD